MCTRYISPDSAAIERHWHVGRDDAWRGDELFPRSLGLFVRAARDATEAERELVVGQWGLVPWFAKAPKLAFATVNARFEDVTHRPSFKDAWRSGRRCVIPALSFDEPNWESGHNVWWRFRRTDDTPWGLAGLWNTWIHKDTGAALESYTMLTINADDHPLMRRMHKTRPEAGARPARQAQRGVDRTERRRPLAARAGFRGGATGEATRAGTHRRRAGKRLERRACALQRWGHNTMVACRLARRPLRRPRTLHFARTCPMNPDQLRSLQAPLKEQYRAQPAAARITLHADGRLGDGVTCSVQTGQALVRAGLHPATGGDGLAACSGDMLLQALVACAGVTLNAVATALGIVLRDAHVRAEGDLDFRGTLGVAKEAPVGFQAIRLHFDLDTDASQEQLATLLRLTERYCVVYQTLAHGPALTVTRHAAAAG